MWAFWEIAKSLLISVVTSRAGQLGIVALGSWLYGIHTTTIKYEKLIAAEKAAVEAAYRAEIQREQYAAREIAEAATRRAEDDLAAAKDMQDIIDAYEKLHQRAEKEKSVPVSDSCTIDADFSRVVQQLGEASYRHPRAARRTSKLR